MDNCVCRYNKKNLIYRLYYKIKTKIGEDTYIDNSEKINYLTDGTDNFRGANVYRMTNRKYEPLNNTKILFDGYRIKPKNQYSGIDQAQYYEKLLIQTPSGEIEASTLYDDGGTGFETTIPFVDYLVNHATNKYIDVKRVRIIFDNNGSISGTKWSRVVEIYH